MVTKSKKVSTGKKKKIKVLNLKKETVRKLTSREAREIKGATVVHQTGWPAWCGLPIKTQK